MPMVTLNEQELRGVLLVRAFEEGDPEHELLGEREREIATRDARAEVGAPAEGSGGEGVAEEPTVAARLVAQRARHLVARIERAWPVVGRVVTLSSRAGPPLWAVLVVALLVGALIDRLGAGGRIDLLSFPILGLLAWNLGVYLVLFLSDLFAPPEARGSEGQASRAVGSGRVARSLLWLLAPERPWRGARACKGATGTVAVCLQRFLRDWFRVGAPLHLARARTRVHLAAAGIMAGAVCGMYLRGLVLHYEVSWESTFLTPDAVHALIEFCFTPAAWILGAPLPDVQSIAALRAPDGTGDSGAAQWIHYYAVTGGLFVVLPRLVLALMSGRRTRGLRRGLELDLESDAYFLRLLAKGRGQGLRAVVQAYSYHPSPRAGDALTTLLLDVLGGRTRVERLAPSEYGDAPVLADGDSIEAHSCRVVLFTLAQSPEDEVHGEYLARLINDLRAAGGDRSVLVVLDQGPFLSRLPRGEEGASRLLERERSWGRVLRQVGLAGVVCELDGLNDAAVLERARAAVCTVSGAGIGR
jgi:hypothetical protein